jgi:hypothetical protein
MNVLRRFGKAPRLASRVLRCRLATTACTLTLACSSTVPPVVEPGSSPEPAPSAAALPLPEPMPVLADGECQRASTAVKAELALAADVWFTVSCVVDALMREQRLERVEAFLADVHQFEVQTDWWLDVEPKVAREAGVAVSDSLEGSVAPPDSGEAVTLYASPAARSRNPALRRVDSKTLGAGGYRGLCLPWQRKPEVGGHYQVTKLAVAAVRKAKFSITQKAEDLMADAAQDPDLFAWNSMPAHGQTADQNGLPSETARVAEDNWRQWIAGWVAEAGRRCSSGAPDSQSQGVYLLGYALHAVEDVASHRGRTNPEHAYNAAAEQNPDKVIGVDALAVEMASSVLLEALNGQARACVAPLRSLQRGLLVFPEKIRNFGFVWDGTPAGLLEYQKSSEDFAPHKEKAEARVRWFGPVGDWPKGSTCQADESCQGVLERLTNALH